MTERDCQNAAIAQANRAFAEKVLELSRKKNKKSTTEFDDPTRVTLPGAGLELVGPPNLTPPAPSTTKTTEMPPILDPERKAEVRAMSVQTAGGVAITAIGLFYLLYNTDAFSIPLFVSLLMFSAKDSLISLVSFLTGARAEKLELKLEKKKTEWEEERKTSREAWEMQKEHMRQALTLANIELASVRKELSLVKEMKEARRQLDGGAPPAPSTPPEGGNE
jgi:hypothetical protein